MPIVIEVKHERVFDTFYTIVKYSDQSTAIIEIEEGAEKGDGDILIKRDAKE